jgi:hypothetical protein
LSGNGNDTHGSDLKDEGAVASQDQIHLHWVAGVQPMVNRVLTSPYLW